MTNYVPNVKKPFYNLQQLIMNSRGSTIRSSADIIIPNYISDRRIIASIKHSNLGYLKGVASLEPSYSERNYYLEVTTCATPLIQKIYISPWLGYGILYKKVKVIDMLLESGCSMSQTVVVVEYKIFDNGDYTINIQESTCMFMIYQWLESSSYPELKILFPLLKKHNVNLEQPIQIKSQLLGQQRIMGNETICYRDIWDFLAVKVEKLPPSMKSARQPILEEIKNIIYPPPPPPIPDPPIVAAPSNVGSTENETAPVEGARLSTESPMAQSVNENPPSAEIKTKSSADDNLEGQTRVLVRSSVESNALAPSTDAPVLSTDGRAPSMEGRIQSTDGRVPSTDGRAPSTDGRAPSTDGRVPSMEGRVPSTDGRVPSTDGRVPSTDGRVPSTDGRVPSTEGRVPSMEGRVPSTDGRVPSMDGRVPSTEAPVPVTDASPSQEASPPPPSTEPIVEVPPEPIVETPDPIVETSLEPKKEVLSDSNQEVNPLPPISESPKEDKPPLPQSIPSQEAIQAEAVQSNTPAPEHPIEVPAETTEQPPPEGTTETPAEVTDSPPAPQPEDNNPKE